MAKQEEAPHKPEPAEAEWFSVCTILRLLHAGRLACVICGHTLTGYESDNALGACFQGNGFNFNCAHCGAEMRLLAATDKAF